MYPSCVLQRVSCAAGIWEGRQCLGGLSGVGEFILSGCSLGNPGALPVLSSLAVVGCQWGLEIVNRARILGRPRTGANSPGL